MEKTDLRIDQSGQPSGANKTSEKTKEGNRNSWRGVHEVWVVPRIPEKNMQEEKKVSF